jgi:hypothetical protein
LAEIIEHVKNIADLTNKNFGVTSEIIKNINAAATL